MSATITKIDFQQKPARGHLIQVNGYRGIYRYPNQEGFYHRPIVDRCRLLKKLKSTTISSAEKERGGLIADLARYHAGLDKNPFVRSEAWTLPEILQLYIDAGCPMKRRDKCRVGESLRAEIAQARRLMNWTAGKTLAAAEFTPEHWNSYRAWRQKHLLRNARGGDRQIDKEGVTLSNAFRCAILQGSKTDIRINPMRSGIGRFRNPDQVTHCRDHMPRSGDELHNLALALFQTPRSQTLGWMLLAQSITGQRAHEVLRMRIDAANKDVPGFIAVQKLYMFRSLSSKGTAGHVDLTRDELAFFTALKNWQRERYPNSPWMFPSPENSTRAIGSTALTHALARITAALGQDKRTSHGLRAFRVNVLRSRGYEDGRIALMIGQKTQGKLIVQVYGEGLDYRLDWMPKNSEPAWKYFEEERHYVQAELAL